MPSIRETRRPRSRWQYAAASLGLIGLGLLSRWLPIGGGSLFSKYPGDVLWAAMIFVGWCVLLPRRGTPLLVLSSGATCLLVEMLKWYQAPWMVALRHTTPGHLVFGHAFSIGNLIAYAIGILMAAAVDGAWVRR